MIGQPLPRCPRVPAEGCWLQVNASAHRPSGHLTLPGGHPWVLLSGKQRPELTAHRPLEQRVGWSAGQVLRVLQKPIPRLQLPSGQRTKVAAQGLMIGH